MHRLGHVLVNYWERCGGFMAFLPIEKQAKFLKEMDKAIVVKPSLTNNKAEVLYSSEMK